MLLLLGRLGLDTRLRRLVTQIECAPGHILEGLALVLGEVLHDPLVDAVGEQQDFDAAFPHGFQMRAAAGSLGCFRRQEIDGALIIAGVLEIPVQRAVLLQALRAGAVEP